MAKQELTGQTWESVEQVREEFKDSPASEWYEFEDRYCLQKIIYQPEDYHGPQRYCKNTADLKHNGKWVCRFHKRPPGNVDNLNPTPGNPKHYMYATDEYLMEHLTDEEMELYDFILEWADIYGIDKEKEPAAYDDLKLLAKQRVREVKASKYIFEEGEIREKVLRDEDGQVILDDDGLPKTEDESNAIADEYRRLINLISSLKKELGITRKEQMKAEDRSTMAGSADTTSQAIRELIDDDEKAFDASEYEES